MTLASSSSPGSMPSFPNVNRFLRFLMTIITDTWKSALADVSTRWPFFFLVLWCTALSFTLILLARFITPPSSACRPDGTFSPFIGYSYWDASGFFQVTLAFGSFTFTQVKIIDVAWDIIIGRAGQGILAYFSWSTFADYATVSMDTTPMTYTTFTTLFIEHGPSFTSAYRLIRDFMLYRRLKSKIATTWIILSILFVFAWPTLVAAMSGYSPETGAYVTDIKGNFVPYNEFQLLAYVIHDGNRINLTTSFPVLYGFSSSFPSVNILISMANYSPKFPQGQWHQSCYYDKSSEQDCDLVSDISDYVLAYGFNGRSRNVSQWRGQTLQQNSLDIEPFTVSEQVLTSLHRRQNFSPAWWFESNVYTLQNLQDNGACKTLGESFQWGFSYIQLFIVLLTLAIWTDGMCLLRHHTHRFQPLRGQPERPRGVRPLLLLAEAIEGQLGASGIDPHTKTNKQLGRHIYKGLKGGSMSFEFPSRNKLASSHSVLHWAKRNLLWLLLAAMSVVFLFVLYDLQFLVLLVAILSAYIIGTTGKSRLFLATLLVLITLPLWWIKVLSLRRPGY
ncbi:hypothetical protein F5Y14DRAFT_398091 [Nemania sp. NC0429]|nr:hypothetical protein F5Y14DRAFT_398091 [Nemania sp. NC0429]